MSFRSQSLSWLFLIVAAVGCVRTADAEVTPEQSQELRQLKRDLAKVTGLLRKKEFDEVDALLDEAEAKVRAVMSAADVPETSRRLLGLPQLIASRRKALELQRQKEEGRAGGEGVSFRSDVAPVIVEHCLECHGANDPRAGLNLSTFAGWKRGGRSGPLLVPGAALNSQIIARLATPDAKLRMPRGRDPLPRRSLEMIATWINQGARFNGDDEETALTELARPRPEVEIPRPQGTETVSFTKDIAPFMVRLCVRCHSGAMPRGGLSLVTFAEMMIGGDSGAVILPGEREESRLFRLVGGLENPRMPQGQARITRKNYEDLVTWFNEGNTFDGDDPYAPLTSYVPTPEQLAAERFASMSADEWSAHRKQRTEELWKRTLPSQDHQTVETDQFLLVGDVTEARLRQIGEWADEHLQAVQRTFDRASEPSEERVWKGKLAVFVFQERVGLTEFLLSVLDRRDSDGLYGDSVVTPTFSDAYIVMQDMGDEASEALPGLRALLREHLTGAFLQRGGDLPDWLVGGAGLHLAHQADRANPYFKGLIQRAGPSLNSLARPVDVLNDGTFSPAAVGPVGYLLVRFLIDRTNTGKLEELVQSLQGGATPAEALPAVIGSDAETFARAFLIAVQGSH